MRHFGLRNLEDLPPIDDFQAPEASAAPASEGVAVPAPVDAVPELAPEASAGVEAEAGDSPSQDPATPSQQEAPEQ
jgi:hypothetical protein